MGRLLAAGLPTSPLVLFHGRLQHATALLCLRHFGGAATAQHAHAAVGAPVAPTAVAAWCVPAPFGRPLPCSKATARSRTDAWRCLAVQQLHAPPGSAGGAAAARHAILPGEVHLWWLDPRRVNVQAGLGMGTHWRPRSRLQPARSAPRLRPPPRPRPPQSTSDLELQRCSELLTDEELLECATTHDVAGRRQRVLARALTRCMQRIDCCRPAPLRPPAASHCPLPTCPPAPNPRMRCRRSVLAGYLPGAPHPRSLLFERNQHGKPRLNGAAATAAGHRLRFNLTHTASMIGLAVTGGWVGARGGAVNRDARIACCSLTHPSCLARHCSRGAGGPRRGGAGAAHAARPAAPGAAPLLGSGAC